MMTQKTSVFKNLRRCQFLSTIKREATMRILPLALISWLGVSCCNRGATAFAPRSSVSQNTDFVRQPVARLVTPSETDAESKGIIELIAKEDSEQQGEFDNNGPLAWMQTYLDLLGVKEGKSVFFGPIPVNVDESKRTTHDEATKRRETAARDLTNINMDERQRRDQAGSIMWVVSALYIAWASLIADDGGLSGHLLRFLSVVPTFLAVGYKLSAKTGL
jgi:hypothetical protein